MAGNEKSPCGLRDIRQATGGLWESRERRRVRVAFMAKWVRLHPSEPLLWGNALHPFDFQLFRFLSCYFLFITQKRHTFVWRFCCASFSSTHFGAEGGIRTPARYYPPTPLAGEPLIATWVLLHGCKCSWGIWFVRKKVAERVGFEPTAWRREWDSNPRLLTSHRFSRPAP